MVAKGPPGGVGVPLLQGGPQVGDPLLDLLQPGRGLRLQALTFSTALIPGTLSDLLQPSALILELRDQFPYLTSPAEHTLMILCAGGRLGRLVGQETSASKRRFAPVQNYRGGQPVEWLRCPQGHKRPQPPP